jgi:hypothetical protein
MKAGYIIKEIWKQCTVEIFFIDWEHSKLKNQESMERAEEKEKPKVVSVWRSIFMCNEWSKLQVKLD